MSRNRTLAATAMLLAAAASAAAAWYGAAFIERHSLAEVGRALEVEGADWVELHADGLQLVLAGTAPSEPARLRAVTRAGRVVDPARVIDAMEVAAAAPLAPPRYSLEILRNDRGISLIGLVPETGGREALARGLRAFEDVTDLVETADRAVPGTWDDALAFALEAMGDLPQSKISVAAGQVDITAIADSDGARRRLEDRLRRAVPDTVTLGLEIAAPRPVVAPFTLRFVRGPGGARFEACAVDSEAALERVLAAAEAAGFEGEADCVIGLGVPSASWGGAVAEGIGALARLPGGSVTFSDADVTLVAAEGTEAELFDTVVAELEAALPDIYALGAVRPEGAEEDGEEGDAPAPLFTATRSAEGEVQLRGRLRDEIQEEAVGSYGRALFGSERTYIAVRRDEAVPRGWPGRVLAGLDALSRLESGSVTVRPDVVDLRGDTGNRRAEAEISGLLSAKLGEAADFRIDVTYVEELDPTLNIPTPEACVERLAAAQDGAKLSFAPGAAVIEAESADLLGTLVGHLKDCERVSFEVAGHTDSQGGEEMNQSLSQQRADAVRLALIERGVPPSQLTARGYGEAQPIADNDTEAGREANRRIAFTLLDGAAGDAPEAAAAEADETGTDETGEAGAEAPAADEDSE
ncbi:OmpA family protein [Jannaschia sp. W003]|uniref:OmpA family protein n=1 Tax=Jannaschia sp. W003 TaxID=2867012 RepID=UPI0021A3B2A0|nr:OmpA family protein [Jannaschia sp. W003]UWQ22722.1 OmpA family protein [Jannaschia sp. W003]